MSAREDLEALVRGYHGEFCMSMPCDCETEAQAEADDLYNRISNGE